MTAVTEEYVAVLRASLTGDEATCERLSADLQARDGGERSGDVLSALTGMALFTAARRRFPDGHTNADVVRLVGQVRARFADAADDIDPRVAERTLHGALGDAAAAENLDKRAMAIAVHALLYVLLEHEGISGDGLDTFRSEARPLADVWLARRLGRMSPEQRLRYRPVRGGRRSQPSQQSHRCRAGRRAHDHRPARSQSRMGIRALERFLEALAASLEGLPGLYAGRGERFPESPTWKISAEALVMASGYE